MKNIRLKVSGMHCQSCEMLIRDALEETEGVASAGADMKKSSVSVLFNEDKISADKIRKIISELGYNAE
ncbi:MAG TPA: heavy-metal-associated domain-containing protein [Nanoarchaeota archaeon]|nr:heavy-metal-associated domain-containing protein [Nanoarchaeota archaeon]